MVDIKTIEGAYLREFDVKKINKKTKKWKKFYNAYRKKKGAVSTSKPKPAKKSSVRSTSMTFNGKKYSRSVGYFGTKAEALVEQKKKKDRGTNAILDKRKAGYFFWIRKK